jgi:hypothetical protein
MLKYKTPNIYPNRKTTEGLVQQGIYEMAAKVLKSNEVHLINFCANPKFQFSKPPLHKYPDR